MLARVRGKSYLVSEPGSFELTAFDANHFKGSFAFKAAPMGKAAEGIAVKGSFDYPCSAPTAFCQAHASK